MTAVPIRVGLTLAWGIFVAFGPLATAAFPMAENAIAAGNTNPWRSPVGRTSDDPYGDLLAALIRHRRFDQAEAWCAAELKQHPASSDEAAWWEIQRCRVQAARQMSEETFDDAAVQRIQQGIQELLQAYPDHPRRMFLLAELRAAEYQAARHDVIAVAIGPRAGRGESAAAPEPESPRESSVQKASAQEDRATVRIARLSTAVDRLADEVAQTRIELDRRRRGATDGNFLAELLRLEQRLLVRRVEVALLASELFPEGSQDHIAAAAVAEGAAEEAMGRLSPDSAARLDLRRLRAVAALRSGDLAAADDHLAPLLGDRSSPPPPNVQAVAVLVDLASMRLQEALRRARRFYGSAPENAPWSLEMDLAALRLRLASEDESLSSIGGWIDFIEQRHGPYARRRAEAISLASLRSASRSDSPLRPAMADAALVAAQGRDWLRRGNPLRAGNLLAAAAEEESDPDQSIQRAVEASAAFASAKHSMQAATVLAEAARRHPGATQAAAASLQAAVLAARQQPVDKPTVKNLLRQTIEAWPQSEAAESARQWLARILVADDQFAAAAEVLTSRPPAQLTESQSDEALDLWHTAYRAQASDDETSLGDRFLHAANPHVHQGRLQFQWIVAAIGMVDRGTLRRLPELNRDPTGLGPDPFIAAVDRFRRSGVRSDALNQPAKESIDLVRWRLMRDARRDPSLRTPVATLLEGWPWESVSEDGDAKVDRLVDRGEWLTWLGQVEQAVEVFGQASKESTSPGKIIRQAAEVLSESQASGAKTAAVGLWDELAAGMPRRTDRWHEAKLAACRLLHQIGNTEEASRRARYVLLTSPPESPRVRQLYEQWIAPSK